MASLNEKLMVYGKLIKETDIQIAYKELMKYIKSVRNHIKEKNPEYNVSENLYQGYMDLTFFSLTTDFIKGKDLKYMVVFTHENMQFQVWLSGRNREVMSKYHKKFSAFPLGDYTLSEDLTGMSSIIEGTLVENPDFDDLSKLTHQIDKGLLTFINDIENKYLSND